MFDRFSLGVAPTILAVVFLAIAAFTQSIALALLVGFGVIWSQAKSFSQFTTEFRDEENGLASSTQL